MLRCLGDEAAPVRAAAAVTLGSVIRDDDGLNVASIAGSSLTNSSGGSFGRGTSGSGGGPSLSTESLRSPSTSGRKGRTGTTGGGTAPTVAAATTVVDEADEAVMRHAGRFYHARLVLSAHTLPMHHSGGGIGVGFGASSSSAGSGVSVDGAHGFTSPLPPIALPRAPSATVVTTVSAIVDATSTVTAPVEMAALALRDLAHRSLDAGLLAPAPRRGARPSTGEVEAAGRRAAVGTPLSALVTDGR